MKPILEVFEKIADELKHIQTLQGRILNSNGEIEFPRLIPVEDDRALRVTEKMDSLIASIARRLRSDNNVVSNLYTIKEWNSCVRRMFGPVLAKLDLEISSPKLAVILKDQIGKAIKEHLVNYSEPREHFFGVKLFSDNDIPEFSIGPVRFESSADWLIRQHDSGIISKVTKRRIEKSWSGDQLRKRESSQHSISEMDILAVTKSYDWVCSVSISKFETQAGLDRVVNSVRNSMTTLALMWEVPSKTLDRFGFSWEPEVYSKIAAACHGSVGILSSRSRSKLAVGQVLNFEDWKSGRQRFKSMFKASQEINEYVLSPEGTGDRDDVLRCLSLAQTWFYDACLESDNLMAVTKFAVCLDTLAKGKGKPSILRLINNCSGRHKTDVIHVDGFTINQLINKIYERGRSEALHGSIKNLFEDWSDTRVFAELLSRECLVACMTRVGNDSSLVKVEEFAMGSGK